MRRNFLEVIADFEAYLLRLISSPLLMRLVACGGYCALSHTCIHSQKQHSPLPSCPCSPCKETAWLEKKSGISSRETFFSLRQVNNCPFFLLSFSPRLGKASSFIISWIPSGTLIWGSDWGLGECQAALPLSSCIPHV